MTARSPAVVDPPEGALGEACFRSLLPALEWLDGLLQRAVAAAQAAYGPVATTDSFRGLYLQHREIEQLLARPPGAPPFRAENGFPEKHWPENGPEQTWQTWLGQEFSLSAFDLRVLVIALAPELDLRYER